MQRSQEPGTQEMMLMPEHNKSQDVPDGLLLQETNYNTQDIVVGPSGVHHLVTPPLATGVVQRAMLFTLSTGPFILVILSSTAVRLLLFVSVPSGV